MASTRSKNTPGDYATQQSENTHTVDYNLYSGYNYHDRTGFAGDGLLPGKYPLQLFNDNCDVESELFGIGSTNLVEPRTPTYLLPTGLPPKRGLPVVSMLSAKPATIVPEVLVVSKTERYT